MPINLTLRQLEVFVAASRARTFSEAADKLGISQPSLSGTISKVEEQLGLRLFDRTTRSLVLTPDGRDLAAVAEDLVRDFEASLRNITERSAGQRGRVSVAVLPSVVASVLPQALQNFAVAFPEVDVAIHDVLQDRAIDLVREGVVDFAITTRPAPYPGLSHEELGADVFHLVCRTDHALADIDPPSWRDVSAHPFVAMAGSTSVRRFADAGLFQAGLVIRPRYEVEQILSAVALVQAGLGVTALPTLTLSMFVREDLTARPVTDPIIRRRIQLLSPANRTLSVQARALMEEVREAFRNRADLEHPPPEIDATSNR